MTSLSEGYEVSIHDSILEVEAEWSVLAPFNLFFSVDYLRLVEKYPPTGIRPFYAVLYKDLKPVGLFYFQYKFIRLGESLRFDSSGSHSFSLSVRKFIADKVNMPTLICGNTLLTGTYGYHFTPEIDSKLYSGLIATVSAHVNDYLESRNLTKGLVLIKDVRSEDHLNFESFTKFEVQPEMTLYLKDDWQTLNDYFDAMKSKYRIRARRAFKKMSGVDTVEFGISDIEKYNTEINSLYQNISQEAGFNLFTLHPLYFLALKETFGDRMKFLACFKDGKLLGFYTALHNYNHLDAHFLGYDYTANHDHQLYLNMLYGLVKLGIENRCEKVIMSRTALEIKSSAGAVPENLVLFLKHSNPLVNRTVPPLLSILTPKVKWKRRMPFRSDTDSVDDK